MAESFSVKINSIDISTFTGDLEEFVVDSNVFLPTMFTILLKDEVLDPLTGALKYTDNQLLFKVGAPVEISVTTSDVPGEMLPVKNTLINGEITAIEPVFDEDGGVMLRLQLPILSSVLDFAVAYQIVAWTAWVPNLLIAEWLLRSQRSMVDGSVMPTMRLHKV